MSPQSTFRLSAASRAALELDAVLALVAELASTDLGRRRVAALEPVADGERLERRRRLLAEVQGLVADGALVPWIEEPLEELGERLEEPRGVLDGGDLMLLAFVLRVVRQAIERIHAADPPLAALAGRVEAIAGLGELEREIRRRLDKKGEVRDDASPALGKLRGRIRGIRDALYSELRSSMARFEEHLAEDTIPVRNGRLVLMVRGGASGRLKGLVHGRSASSKSVYFEPLEVVEQNNEQQEAIAAERAERQRILEELGAAVRGALPEIGAQLELLADLDALQAMARFADRAAAAPAKIAPRHELLLEAARHPLLDPRLAPLREAALGQAGHTEEITPLDLEISKERRVLTITGPNAGGKTVALKTVGVLALANQCGIPIPAGPNSRLPLFDAVVAMVGDDQSVIEERSTFSARLMQLGEAWEAAGPDALVLLDELGSGTDPEEGAALSIALLEGLLENGATAVLTTHLTPLAAAALDREGAACAAMHFDAETGRPTYELMPGPPGSSEALALAARLGLDPGWIARAEELLGGEHRNLRRALREVEALRATLSEQSDELAKSERRAARTADELEQERTALAEDRRRLSGRLKRDLESFRTKVRAQLGDEVERLRQELEGGRRRALAAQATERIFEEAPKLEVEEEPSGPLTVGAEVRHRGFGWQGVVEKLERGRAEIRVRGKKVRCAAGDLLVVEAPPEPKRRRRAHVEVTREDEATAPSELKLIGERVEPALDRLDSYLDRALLSAHCEVRIVHGHGTGQLRRAVRDHLKTHPGVAKVRPGGEREGGDGATVVTLRE